MFYILCLAALYAKSSGFTLAIVLAILHRVIFWGNRMSFGSKPVLG
jgi:hypothetical protein